MSEIVLFGGTSEGRKLVALLAEKKRSTLLCVATKYGEDAVIQNDWVHVHTGRLDKDAMRDLLEKQAPTLVIDATHPYATVVSQNIQSACDACKLKYMRVLRETLTFNDANCMDFFDMQSLIKWLNTQSGVIFSTLGTKEAANFAKITDFKERTYLRILPDVAGLQHCLNIGFAAKNIICMQGPFSKALNKAMFSDANASILVTKESGHAGGFAEKISAAQDYNMKIALLRRPPDQEGIPFATLLSQIEEGHI